MQRPVFAQMVFRTFNGQNQTRQTESDVDIAYRDLLLVATLLGAPPPAGRTALGCLLAAAPARLATALRRLPLGGGLPAGCAASLRCHGELCVKVFNLGDTVIHGRPRILTITRPTPCNLSIQFAMTIQRHDDLTRTSNSNGARRTTTRSTNRRTRRHAYIGRGHYKSCAII